MAAQRRMRNRSQEEKETVKPMAFAGETFTPKKSRRMGDLTPRNDLYSPTEAESGDSLGPFRVETAHSTRHARLALQKDQGRIEGEKRSVAPVRAGPRIHEPVKGRLVCR